MNTRKTACVVLALVIVFCIAHSVYGGRFRGPKAERLAPVPTERGVSGRWFYQLPLGPCIVMRHPLVPITPEAALLSEAQAQRFIIYSFPIGSPWYVPPHQPELLTTFNCAALAIGDVIHLSKIDWLEPKATCETANQNPTSILLSSYFDIVETHSLNKIDWREVESNDIVHDQDIVVLVNVHDRTTEYVHLGKIMEREGRNWMISKLGNGPIIRGSIQDTAALYSDSNELRIYRKR